MKRQRPSSKRLPRLPSVLNLKRMALAFAGVAAALGAVATVHHFAEPKTKAAIESGTLAVIDIVRECRATPQEVVFWLDLAADAMPMMRGAGVAVSEAEFAATADELPGGFPKATRNLTLLKNTGYTVGYDEARKTPAWAVYKVRKPTHPLTPRPADFEADGRTRARIRPSDYSHSGYDRGHMAPNFAIAVGYGEQAQRETFLMSNITPQLHGLNDGLWRAMEHRIATRYPARFGEAWVVCGPVYDHPEHPKTIRAGIAVPDAFYLVVIDRDEDTGELRAQGYLVPHRAIPDNDDPSAYLTDLRTLEARTGLDFFAALPREKQNALEQTTALKAW